MTPAFGGQYSIQLSYERGDRGGIVAKNTRWAYLAGGTGPPKPTKRGAAGLGRQPSIDICHFPRQLHDFIHHRKIGQTVHMG